MKNYQCKRLASFGPLRICLAGGVGVPRHRRHQMVVTGVWHGGMVGRCKNLIKVEKKISLMNKRGIGVQP